MTIEKCIAHCVSKNFAYAGVQYKTQFFCGDNLPVMKSKDSDCNTRCAGNKDQICGGGWRNSVYEAKPRFATMII